jgi:hypothetical protein
MYDDFIAYLRENQDEAEEIFQEGYAEKAEEEGSDMQDDERYYGEDGNDYDPAELYEDFAHCVGHSASYYGAYSVIKEFAEQMDDERLDVSDEELQELVLEELDQTID